MIRVPASMAWTAFAKKIAREVVREAEASIEDPALEVELTGSQDAETRRWH